MHEPVEERCRQNLMENCLCGIFHTPSKWDMSFDVVTWSSEGNKVVIDPVFPLFWGGVMAAGFSLTKH